MSFGKESLIAAIVAFAAMAVTVGTYAYATRGDLTRYEQCLKVPDPAKGCATSAVFNTSRHRKYNNVLESERAKVEALARSGLATSATWITAAKDVAPGLYVGTAVSGGSWLHVPTASYGDAREALAPFLAAKVPTYGSPG